MVCNHCGTEYSGKFCPNCGTNAPENAPAHNDALKSILIDPSEEIQAVIGNSFIQTFLTTGVLGNGFAILSNKRVYFKGKCFVRQGKSFSSKTEENTVDLKDVTGSAFVYNNAIWAKILSIVFLVMCGTELLPVILNNMLSNSEIAEQETFLAAEMVMVLISAGLSALFYYIYKKFTYSLFQISFAGGAIAFDMHCISQTEAKKFQQQMVLLKQTIQQEKIEENVTKITPETLDDIPSQIKKYKELFDEGIITESEFEEKKKQLLNL